MSQSNPYADVLKVAEQEYQIFSLTKAATRHGTVDRLPFCLKVLL